LANVIDGTSASPATAAAIIIDFFIVIGLPWRNPIL
jgi:hypothetical protein